MEHTSFYFNYGGPSFPLTRNPVDYDDLERTNRNYYKVMFGEFTFMAKGLDITVYTHSLHRSIKVELPENSSENTQKLFEQVDKMVSDLNKRSYRILSNNCVTSVAAILHCIDAKICPKQLWLPWSLDANIKSYLLANPSQMAKEKTAPQSTRLFKNELFHMKEEQQTKSNFGSAKDKTKTDLLEKEWVKEDNEHLLWPTDKARSDFTTGLIRLNHNFIKVNQVKKCYRKHSGPFSLQIKRLFSDNPSFETIVQRLEVRATKNPGGASSKVLDEIKHNLSHGLALDDEPNKPLIRMR